MRQVITVFGGTGFVGRRIVRRLLRHGFAVRAVSRHAGRAAALFGSDEPAPEAVEGDVHDARSVAAALSGAFGAVNAVSLYVEHGRETFRSVHVDAAGRLARLGREEGLARLVHLSGIGSDPRSGSPYIRARGEGEIAVADAFADATLIRPAVMVGRDDAFLTTMVRLLRTLPAYPMFGHGETRLQPVHVEDVGEAAARLFREPSPDRVYELAGPRIYTYRDLLLTIAGELRLRARLVPLPFALWSALAYMSEFLPNPPLTRNQVDLMRHDNVAAAERPGLTSLGIEPAKVEDVLREIGGEGATPGRNRSHHTP